jgi:transposase-like protein
MPVAANFVRFCQKFSTEQSCADALFHLRWPTGFRCPQCGHFRYYRIQTRRLPLFECAACRRQTSVTAGTILEGSRTPLVRWFQAIFLLAAPEGISSIKLAKMIQVSYKTAWLMTHKIRHAMQKADQAHMLNGIVRIEHASYGYDLFIDASQPLLIGASMDPGANLQYVKIKQPLPVHVNNKYRKILPEGVKSFLRTHVKDGAFTIQPSYSNYHPQLRRISWNLGYWLNHTFCGIGAKHLQAYVDEFCFRLNAQLRRMSALDSLMHQCSATRTITYKKLIQPKPVLPVPWIRWGGRNKWRGRYLVWCNT